VASGKLRCEDCVIRAERGGEFPLFDCGDMVVACRPSTFSDYWEKSDVQSKLFADVIRTSGICI